MQSGCAVWALALRQPEDARGRLACTGATFVTRKVLTAGQETLHELGSRMLSDQELGQSGTLCLHEHKMCSVRNEAARHCMGRVTSALWDGRFSRHLACTTKHQRAWVSSRAVQATDWHVMIGLAQLRCSSHHSQGVLNHTGLSCKEGLLPAP